MGMDEMKKQAWEMLKTMMKVQIENEDGSTINELLHIGLPALMAAIDDGIDPIVKRDAKELFVLAIDKLAEHGIALKIDSPLRKDYVAYKKELAVDEKVNAPLAEMFETLTLDKILNAPIASDLPNN